MWKRPVRTGLHLCNEGQRPNFLLNTCTRSGPPTENGPKLTEIDRKLTKIDRKLTAFSRSQVAALAARFRSPTEPPPLPQALQKQRRRVSHPTKNPSQPSASSTRPHNPMLRPQSATPSDHRPMPPAANARPQTSFTDVSRVQIDASSRPMSDILRQFGGVTSGSERPPIPANDRLRPERSSESGGPSERRVQWADRENSLVDDFDANGFSDGDADRKEISGVEPEQLLAALQRQLDASGNLVDAGRRFGQVSFTMR